MCVEPEDRERVAVAVRGRGDRTDLHAAIASRDQQAARRSGRERRADDAVLDRQRIESQAVILERCVELVKPEPARVVEPWLRNNSPHAAPGSAVEPLDKLGLVAAFVP